MPYTDYTARVLGPNSVLPIMPRLLHVGYEHNEPDWFNLEHAHNACEIIFMQEGRESAVIDGNRFEIRTGEALVINSGAVHQEWANSETTRNCIICTFDNFQLKGLPPNHLVDRSESPVVALQDDFEFVSACFNLLLQEAIRGGLYGYTMSQTLLMQIIISLMRSANSPEKLSRKHFEECSIVKEYIDAHFHEEISLDDLASRVFVSRGHLSHVFRAKMGEAPIQYLIRKRLDEAKRLLVETDWPIQQVSKQVGYESSVYFCQLFSKRTGLAPSVYRRRYRMVKDSVLASDVRQSDPTPMA